MSQFDRAFSATVRQQLDDLCQEFQEAVRHKLADKIQEDHPELPHSQIVDAIGRFIRTDGDGSEDKAERWFEFNERDIAPAFKDQFSEDDDEDNSDVYVAHYDRVEREAMSASYEAAKSLEERRPDIYTRYIRWVSDGSEDMVYFSSKGSQPGEDYSGENDPDDHLIHFYGLTEKEAVAGYTNGEWVIIPFPTM